MKISAINTLKFTPQPQLKNNSQQRPQAIANGAYNPIYYTDYNVSVNFGKRSPEDFYAQDFNRRNMPETMKKYLYADFTQRSKIAPIQIMQESFDSLSAATTTDDIKELFPNEQKFEKLRPANYNGATGGIMKKIKDIKTMQDTPEPLFKDGSDDLTTYLVKKIYLEGKTVKEIDKDFAHDINPIYELAAKIPAETQKALGKNESAYFSHSTVYNLGIRFPEVPFWNSFIATRDDYERTQRVKSLTGEFVNADSAEGKAAIAHRNAQTPKAPATPKPRKYNFKRHDLKQISDAIINSKGETSKVLKDAARGGRNTEELSFLQQYWSQIMSVATEKIHLSDEMIDFNADRKAQQLKVGEDTVDKFIRGLALSANEKTPLQIFWNERTDLKAHFSNAITDTVMLFTDAYGADGNNDEFKALLNYAQGIKPARDLHKLEHARIQAEYDEMAKFLKSQEKPAVVETPVIKPAEEVKPNLFNYEIAGHDIVVPFDIKKEATQSYKNDFDLIPNKMFDIYMHELDELVKDDRNRFYLSCCFEKAEDTPEINRILYSNEYMNQINEKLVDTMELKYNPYLEGTRLSFFELAEKNGVLTPEFVRQNTNQDILTVRDRVRDLLPKEAAEAAHQEIQNIFLRIMKPLSNKEKNSSKIDVFNYLRKYDMTNAIRPESSVPRIIKLISLGISRNPSYANNIKSCLGSEKVLNEEGPILRYLLDPQGDKALKNMIREQTLQHIVRFFPETVSVIATSCTEEFPGLMRPFPEEMHGLKILAQKALAKKMLRLK